MEFKDRLQFLFVIRQINFSSSFFSLLSKENQFNFSWRGGSQIAFMIFLFCFCFSFSSSSSYIYIMTKFLLDFRKKEGKARFLQANFLIRVVLCFFSAFLGFYNKAGRVCWNAQKSKFVSISVSITSFLFWTIVSTYVTKKAELHFKLPRHTFRR